MNGSADTGVRPFRAANFYWPETIPDVRRCVEKALSSRPRMKVRVRGSQHSEKRAVYTTGFDPVSGPPPTERGMINLILDHLLSFRVSANEIAVGAGHHLGADPYARGPARQLKNSLVSKLDQLGLALPALGGISHQSLGGFLSTGSAGGSVQHDLTDAIQWITMVDGAGEVQTIDRRDQRIRLDAVLPAMGLFGIIVEVGFDRTRLPRKFDVAMTSQVLRLERWGIDPFQEGELAKFFRENEYARILWWPQPLVNKVEVWTGQRIEPHDPCKKKPYVSFSPEVQQMAHWLYLHILKDPSLERAGAHPALGDVRMVVRAFEERFGRLHPDVPPGRPARRLPHLGAVRRRRWLSTLLLGLRALPRDLLRGTRAEELLVATILHCFLRDESHDDLRDIWYRALPHDNQVDDNAIPVVFTEMWIDLDRADEVMRKLKDLFRTERLRATGTMCFEIYAAKKRSAWMSPAHDVDVLRVDPFIFGASEHDHQRARAFFERHWEALEEFQFRNHWGKVLPPGDGTRGVSYRRETFPELHHFLALRRRFDPEGIFLTDYWREHLGI